MNPQHGDVVRRPETIIRRILKISFPPRKVSGMALATGVCRQKHWEALAARGELISSFNGKPEALPLDFAYAYGSPLNENQQTR